MDFAEIYLQYAPQIFRVCMGYTNDYEQAKDLTQETFIAVWQNLGSFRGESKVSTWIFRIATNHCLRARERARRGRVTALPEGMDALPAEEYGPGSREAERTREKQLRFLYACIAELEETDRIIISLELEDLPQAEIAAVVGLSAVNTRVRIHRIRERLAAKFRHHGQFE